MPNRVNDPVQLEQFVEPSIIRQAEGLFCHYYNKGPNAILMGEPVVFGGRVGLAQRVILPGKYGTLVFDFVADLLLDPANNADIDQGDTVYWDLDKDAVTYYNETAVLDGIGAASRTQPTNGFIIGTAVGNRELDLGVDGGGNKICATTGSKYVRVVSLPGATTEYSA